MEYVDLAAIDCITNPTTGLPFGIVAKRSQRLTIGKDEKPDPDKFDPLVKEIKRKLRKMSSRYDRMISYLNVRSYWDALESVREEFDITMLPRVYANHKRWNSKKLRMGPIGMFKTKIYDLVREIDQTVSGF